MLKQKKEILNFTAAADAVYIWPTTKNKETFFYCNLFAQLRGYI